MSDNLPAPKPTLQGLSGRKLARLIFEAELPESYIKSIPAQSLYLAIKENGLSSSIDILEIATIEQSRLLLDFDLWEKDELNEDNIWDWLALSDTQQDLEFLQKLLKFIDLKIVAWLISKYVKFEVFEQPNDEPPGPSYYTPDKGFTWILVELEDSTKHFLLTRFLALIFETSVELFYQLMSIPNVSTQSQLLEESYEDKCKRLSAEGIPDFDFAARLNAPINEKKFIFELNQAQQAPIIEQIQPIEPLIFGEQFKLEPLASFLIGAKSRENVTAELSLLMNAALIFYGVPYYEHDLVLQLAEKVKGAINLGIERTLELKDLPVESLYQTPGLQKIYGLGLSLLGSYRNLARKIPQEKITMTNQESAAFSIIANALERFPLMPAFFKSSTKMEGVEGKLTAGSKPIEHLTQLRELELFLNANFFDIAR